MSEQSDIERPKARRFRRLTTRVTVDIRSADRSFSATATTLGAGGLFVEAEKPFPPNTILNLRFQLPGSERIYEIQSRVVWSTPSDSESSKASRGMGIEFTDRLVIAALAREIETAG